jgi:hypothetical protein
LIDDVESTYIDIGALVDSVDDGPEAQRLLTSQHHDAQTPHVPLALVLPVAWIQAISQIFALNNKKYMVYIKNKFIDGKN